MESKVACTHSISGQVHLYIASLFKDACLNASLSINPHVCGSYIDDMLYLLYLHIFFYFLTACASGLKGLPADVGVFLDAVAADSQQTPESIGTMIS